MSRWLAWPWTQLTHWDIALPLSGAALKLGVLHIMDSVCVMLQRGMYNGECLFL